jgi:hypothetical protein
MAVPPALTSPSRLSAIALMIALALGLTGSRDLWAAQNGAAQNLVDNADFSKGAGESPDHWRTESWDQKSDVSSYAWIHQPGEAAQLEVNNAKPNDARWMQAINLDPGWYYLSVQVRTEGVGDNATGASVSIMEDGAMSHDVRGTTPWREIGFYLKVSDRGGDIEIACRVGGYASLNTGLAFFRDVKVVAVTAPAEGEPRFELDSVRKESAEPPVGKPWTLAATFILLAAIAYFGWTMFDTPIPEARQDRVVQREPPKKSARR